MLPIYYGHPFSSYCWKALIALRENQVEFDYRRLDDPANVERWQALSPFDRMPLLIDGETVVPEATIIIEYLQQHHPGPVTMIPAEPSAALRVRLLDRLSDNYLMGFRLGEYLKKAKPNGGTVCLIEGNAAADNILRRASGTRDSLAGKKGIEMLKGEGGWTEIAGCPVVFMSRSDTTATRLNSLALALAMFMPL